MESGWPAGGAEGALLQALDVLLGVGSGGPSISSSGRGATGHGASGHGASDEFGSHELASDDAVVKVIAHWRSVNFPDGDVAGWTPTQAQRGLVALEEIDRALAALRSALVVRVGLGRDTAAALTRSTGMSQRAARDLVRVAQTIANSPVVGERLARGEVSAMQVRAVAGLGADDAVGLLDVASGQTDDEFARTVERFKVESAGHTRTDRQRAARSVRFSDGPDGCVRMNALLPAVEGAEMRGIVERACDAAWKAAHPQRARTVGGHEAEPRERRMADALMSVLRGECGGVAGVAGVPAVIVTVDAETLRTTVLPDTPVDPGVLLGLLERADVYAAVRDHTKPARLSFGRNRRLASPLQRLVLAMLQPRCTVEGCDVPANRCEAHHVEEYDAGGLTDLENLANLCSAHHHHVHQSQGIRPHRAVRQSRRQTPCEADPDP